MAFEAFFIFQGAAEKDRTEIRFELSDAAYADAAAAVGQLYTDFGLVSDAVIRSYGLREVIGETGNRPAFGVNASDEAIVSVYLDADGKKIHTMRVPAPKEAVFQPDAQTVDTTNADLIGLVATMAANVLLSDNESINTTTTNGLKSGYRRTRKKLYK